MEDGGTSGTVKKDNNNASSSNNGNGNNNSRNEEPLPKNRFELELEFLQCLASPAYLHFLATSSTSDTLTTELLPFFKYLRRTYSQPEYVRYVRYPNAFYFLDLLIDRPNIFFKEFKAPEFRNFCHNQQFLAWQSRHASCYGVGKAPAPVTAPPMLSTDGAGMTTTTTTTTRTTTEQEDNGEPGDDGDDTVMEENDGADGGDTSS
jgi:mediator of RNA polymerase II transcription subunit 31